MLDTARSSVRSRPGTLFLSKKILADTRHVRAALINTQALYLIMLRIPKKTSALLAEETGLHIGDGTMNYYKKRHLMKGKYSLRGHLVDDRAHYDTRVREIYYLLYRLEVPNMEMPSTGVYGFQLWNDELVKFKSEVLGLPLGWKTNITIPKVFMSQKKYQLAVLRGIYDTDGNVYIENKRGKPYLRAKFSNTSQALTFQIHSILLSCEIRATLHCQKRNNPNWNDLYNVEIRGEKNVTRLFAVINPTNQKHLAKFKRYFS